MTTQAPPARATWRTWLGLVVLTVPLFMAATDMSVLFLALPAIAADLSPGSTQQLWILHIGEFLAVGFALTMGRLGDRIGRRRLLTLGVAVYGLASLAAAYSTSPEMLIAMRALLGMAAATLMPTIMALLRNMFTDSRQFSMAVAVIMSSFSAGMALGPPLGGLILEYFWWGAVFLVNVPAATLLLMAVPLLPSYRAPEAGRVDMVSVALSVAAIIAVIFGLQELADRQASNAGEPLWPYGTSVVLGIVLAVVFVRRQLRLADPLLDLRLFTTPAFTVSVLAMLGMLLALGGTDMLFAQYLQAVLGLSPGQAGLLLIAPALASVVGGMVAPVLTWWARPAFIMAGGLLVAAAGATAVALLTGHVGGVPLVALVTLVALAMGPLFTLSANLIVGTAPLRRAGSAAAMTDIGTGLGNALSLAFLGSLAAVVYRWDMTGATPEQVPGEATHAASDSIGGATAVAQELPEPVGQELLEAAQSAFSLGMQAAYGVGAVLVTLLALLVAWRLRHASIEDTNTEDA